MADRDVMELVRFEKKLSIDIAIKAKKNCELVKTHGEPMLIKAYSGVILMAIEFFNTGQQMSEMQAIQTASLLIEQYPAETIEDLVLCFKNVKTSRYGKIFNRIDGQLIFEWFRLYLDEKYERFEQIKHMEKVSHQVTLDESFLPVAESILSASKNSSNVDDEKETVNRLTAEKHFTKFQEFVKTLSLIELESIREYYSKENAKTFYNQYQQYIDTIDSQIKQLQKEQ